MNTLKFEAPNCAINISFWEELYKKKLEILKLNDSRVDIFATRVPGNGGGTNNQSLLLSRNSFGECNDMKSCYCGTMLNVNTIEEFRDLDKKKLLEQIGYDRIWKCGIINGDAIKNPCILYYYVLLTFGDLKNYKFMHWYGAPAIIPETSTDSLFYDVVSAYRTFDNSTLSSCLMNACRVYISKQLAVSDSALLNILPPVLMLTNENGVGVLKSLEEGWSKRFQEESYVIVLDDTEQGAPETPGLNGASIEAANSSGVSSGTPTSGWGVRNLLALLAATVRDQEKGSESCVVNLINLNSRAFSSLVEEFAPNLGTGKPVSSRTSVGISMCLSTSLVFKLRFPVDNSLCVQYDLHRRAAGDIEELPAGLPFRFVGWEMNERGKPGPRLTDVGVYLDPNQLLSQACNLNLKLMKWRLWEKLEVDKISKTRCLLLGAGTLGCAVGRVLLGWGVNCITFVDNGKVSYSNPTRQCLYNFQDCINKSYKADAAAKHVLEINPNVDCKGVVLTIPMPGHILSTSEDRQQAADAHEKLSSLFNEHDVIFVLTDSREARWLATLMHAASGGKQIQENKIMLDVALGFDSYVVMRHGCSIDTATMSGTGSRLGCYFCNDIIGVQNTLKDRTLDQQCTVTRPGLAYIASALAVEMMIAMLHCDPITLGSVGKNASFGSDDPRNKEESSEFVENRYSKKEVDIPHQIRGSLVGFTQIDAASPALGCCTACSASVVEAYRQNNMQFIECVAENPKYLEELSGINKLTENVNLDDVMLMGDDDWDDAM